MRYRWDRRKARANLIKHGVDFAEAVFVLEDELALTVRDPDHVGEDRFLTLGMELPGRVLVVAFVWRGDDIRIISARKATRRERIEYEER